MAALETSNPNRFAHGEAMARKRASSSEKRNSKTSIIGSLISGDGSRSRTNSTTSQDAASERARGNWKKAGLSVRAMLAFKKGAKADAVSERTSESGDIPDRFAHGLAAAQKKVGDQKAAKHGKPSVIKRMSSGGGAGGGTRSRGNSVTSNEGDAA